jgi:hypothetical protein
MMLKNQAAVPLDQVLPLFLGSLPLRRDYAESEMVFNAILTLLQQQNPTVLSSLDHVLAIFASALKSTEGEVYYPSGDSQITVENKNRLVQLVKALPADKVQQAGLAPYL